LGGITDMRRLLVLLALLALPSLASAREGWRGWCEQGNNSVVTSGISSTTKVQRSFPRCQVLVLVHGAGVAQIYSDNQGTVLANPFQANLDGSWEFYADDGRYDVSTTMTGLSFTYLDILLCDPFVPGAVCAGGTGNSHNLLSTTHLDTIPFSPPVRGDLIVAQNQTSPTGVNPAWARLPLGTLGQVVISTGTDAVWGNVTAGTGITITPAGSTLTISTSGGGGGCTLPGTNHGVLSESPIGTCLDGPDWTWDDGASKQNMQAGLSNVIGSKAALTFTQGDSNQVCSSVGTSCTDIFTQGSLQQIESGGNTTDTFAGVWSLGRLNIMAGQVQDSYIIGGGGTNLTTNFMNTDATSSIVSAMCLMQGCSQNAGGINASNGAGLSWILMAGNQQILTARGSGALVQDIFLTGAFSTATVGNSSSDTSLMSSVFKYGETFQSTVTGNSSFQDYYSIGTGNTGVFGSSSQNSTGASAARYMIDVGFSNTFTASGAGTLTGAFAFGDKLHFTNCLHCFAIGENITTTTSNILSMGLNTVPGLVISSASSHDNVLRSPLPFTSVPACAAGTEGSFASITTSNSATNGVIITGGGTNHVLAFCDGTNWKVVVGT
jgi:hypothetical protein